MKPQTAADAVVTAVAAMAAAAATTVVEDSSWLSLSVGGLDYTNLGSSDVAGTSVFWGDLGFRWKLTPNLSVGAAYGFPISTPGNDAFNQRVTFDMVFSF